MQPLQNPGPGVPLTLAEERARRVSDLRYDLQLLDPRRRAARVTGRVAITFVLKDATRPLSLDFAAPKGVRSVRLGAQTITPAIVTDHIVLAPEDLREGRNEISSNSSPATTRSIATRISSTRSSCRRGHTGRSPVSISRI